MGLGTIIGTALGSPLVGAVADYALGEHSAKTANNRNVYNAQHSYQWMMQDMQRAGLNPILASKMGPLSIPSSPMNPNSAIAANSASQSLIHAQDENSRMDTLLKESGISVNEKQMNQLMALTDKLWAESQGQDYKNMRDAIRAKIHQDNKWVTFAQEIGASAGTLSQIVNQFISKIPGFGKKKTGSTTTIRGPKGQSKRIDTYDVFK